MDWWTAPGGPRELGIPGLILPHTAGVLVPLEEGEHGLAAAELALVAQALPGRRREFAAGRRSAKQALGHVGISPQAILRRDDRSPIWPDGVVGSISHCRHYAAAGASTWLAGLGLDIECRGRLHPQVFGDLFSERERRSIGSEAVATTLFSAKEAIFKAAYPLLGRTFDFRDIEVELALDVSRFSARAVDDAGIQEVVGDMAGAFSISSGHVLTLATLAPWRGAAQLSCAERCQTSVHAFEGLRGVGLG